MSSTGSLLTNAAAAVAAGGTTPLGPARTPVPDTVLHRLGVSPPVHLHQLLTDWQLGHWTADLALVLQLTALGLYLWGVRRLAARGRRWSPWRTGSFAAGVAVAFLAVDSGVASYDTSVFSVHVLQHLALMMLAPPLVALGAPVTLALQASSRGVQTGILRVLRARPLVALTTPLVAAALYYAAMWVDLASSFYRYSLAHPFVHNASHLVMFSLGYLYWWSVLGTDRTARQLSLPARLGGVVVGMPFEVFLGIALLSTRSPVAPEHTLSDTHAGGGAFWVLSMLFTGAGALWLFVQWMRQEERRAVREDRQLAGASPEDGPRSHGSSRHDAWAAAWAARGLAPPPTVTTPPGDEQPAS